MIVVHVNGEPVEVSEGSTLDRLVEAHVAQTGGVAVAVNEAVIPRSAWASTALGTDDRIEILNAAPGG